MSETPSTYTKPPINWWALPLGIIGIVIGVWTSFFYLSLSPSGALVWVIGAVSFVTLLGGVFCLGRFILDFILRGIGA